MAFEEDLTVFFDTDDHAVTATYNGSTPVNGIHDDDYYDQGNGLFQGSKPVFKCALADVPGLSKDKTLVIGSDNFKIVNWQPDGTGVVLLILEKQ